MLSNEIVAYLKILDISQVFIGQKLSYSRKRVNNVVRYRSKNRHVRTFIADIFEMPVNAVFNGQSCSKEEIAHLNEIIALKIGQVKE